jgi:hypothetical protein
MHAHLHRCSAERLGSRRRSLAALALSLVTLLAAMPTASALAESTAAPSAVTPQTQHVSASMIEIPAEDLQPILGTLPVSDLGLSESELVTLITGLHTGTLGALGGTVTTVVGGLLAGNPPSTLEQLTAAVLGNGLLATALGLAGVTITPEEIVLALSPSQLTGFLSNLTGGLGGEQLTTLLSGLAGTLTPEQLTALQPVLAALTGALSAEQLQALRGALHALPGGLEEGELAPLGPAQLATLVDEAFATASPSQLAPIVGELLGAVRWSAGTTTSLAEILGVPLETLAGGLGETVEGGYGEVPALTGALGGEEGVAGVLPKTTGLAFGLLKPLSEGLGGGEEGAGGEEGGGSGGSSGGSGGSGSSGSGAGGSGSGSGSPNAGGSTGGAGGSGGSSGGLTLVVNLQPSQSGGPAPGTRAVAAKQPGRVRILSHRVHGNVATVVLQVPSAGALTLRGWGTRSPAAHPRKAERVTLRVRLSRVGKAALHGHAKRLRVRLKATFKPLRGASSTASATVTFG